MNFHGLSQLKHSFRRPSPFILRSDRPPLSRLTVICCAAGYGKTAYLSQLSEEIHDSACISFDTEDDDPLRIITLLTECVPEGFGASDVKGYEALDKAVQYFSENEVTLLLDNADRLRSDKAASVIGILAEAAVSGAFRIVLAVRSIPVFFLEYVMNGEAALMGAEEMSFTSSETASLVKELRPDFSENLTSEIYSFTSGWCIAVSQLARSGKKDLPLSADESYLPEYIKYNISDTLDNELRRYLLISAFLQGDDEFYREGLKISDASYSRGVLTRMGIAPDTEGYLEYPAVLRQLLSDYISDSEKSELIEKASGYYITRNRFAEAVRLFEVSGNVNAAERILSLYGGKMLANCEFELIGYCGSIIGSPEKVRDPEALGALAQYFYYNGEYEKMEQALNLADSMFGKENRFSVLRKLYRGLLRYELRPELYSDNVRSAVEWLREKDQPLPFLYRKELDVLKRITESPETNEESQVLYVRRFGGIFIRAGKQKTELQFKTKRSPEIIAFMLEQDGKPVSREKLLNALWPEDMPANAVAMLHNMIYNLRRVLAEYGLENIITYKNKYYQLNTELIAEEDRDILNALTASQDKAGASAAEITVLKNYPGKYLEGCDSIWAAEKREYYDRCYIGACTAVSEKYMAEGRFDEAESLLKNAYHLDPFSEQLLYDLLNCFSGLGKPDKVREYYEEYSARLDAEFGTRPAKWLRNHFLSCFSADTGV